MKAQTRHRSWFRRMSWHPIVVAFPLAWFVMRVATDGFTPMRTIGLCWVTLWFVLAVIDRLTQYRLTDWIYSDDERET